MVTIQVWLLFEGFFLFKGGYYTTVVLFEGDTIRWELFKCGYISRVAIQAWLLFKHGNYLRVATIQECSQVITSQTLFSVLY